VIAEKRKTAMASQDNKRNYVDNVKEEAEEFTALPKKQRTNGDDDDGSGGSSPTDDFFCRS
jgi:hypothetical protein